MRVRARLATIATVSLILTLLAPASVHAAMTTPSGQRMNTPELLNGAPVADNVQATDADVTPSATDSAPSPAAGVPVYRFYSPLYRGHFFTLSASERDRIISTMPEVWRYEGQRYTAFKTQVEGTVPLYRFWSANLKGHFFTTSVTERERVIRTLSHEWRYENIAYYVYPMSYAGAGTVTVARFWSPTARHHFYTASASERNSVLAKYPPHVWTYEGDNYRVPAVGVHTSNTPPPNPGDTKNCNDFVNYIQAKAWFDLHYPHYGDVARLDQDNDRIPCETLPGAPGN